MNIKFFDRTLAVTDVETTGLDPTRHEIIDIGLVLMDQTTLKILVDYDVRVRPTHIETASAEAMTVNGYRPEDWQRAVPLAEAMGGYARMTKDAVFLAHNVTFDWSFISAAFRETGVANEMGYHRLDLLTMAWVKLRDRGLDRFSLDTIANHLGLPAESKPHCAINGARLAAAVLQKLAALP